MPVRSKLFCRIKELNFRHAAHGKNQTEHGREKGWTEEAHQAFALGSGGLFRRDGTGGG
jgi:hypothetical protein